MPTVAITEITEEQDLAHEACFDLNDHTSDVLDAIEFEHSKDALDFILQKDNVDIDGIVEFIEESGFGVRAVSQRSGLLRLFSTDKLFQEIMRRNGGEAV
jgi:hypothetical protein